MLENSESYKNEGRVIEKLTEKYLNLELVEEVPYWQNGDGYLNNQAIQIKGNGGSLYPYLKEATVEERVNNEYSELFLLGMRYKRRGKGTIFIYCLLTKKELIDNKKELIRWDYTTGKWRIQISYNKIKKFSPKSIKIEEEK